MARITITNMFVAMIESLRNDLKSELITKTLSRTPHQYRNTRIENCVLLMQPEYVMLSFCRLCPYVFTLTVIHEKVVIVRREEGETM